MRNAVLQRGFHFVTFAYTYNLPPKESRFVLIRRNVNKNEVSVKVKHEQEEKSQDYYITDIGKTLKPIVI